MRNEKIFAMAFAKVYPTAPLFHSVPETATAVGAIPPLPSLY